MSRMVIYLVLPSPAGSSDLPESTPGRRIAFCSVLLRMEFTCARSVTTTAVVSYTAFPPLPSIKKAVYFCCTGLGVTSTGRYPASCPVKPGLSSPGPFRSCQPRLHILLRHKTEHQTVNNHITKLLYCPSPNLRNTLRESYTSKQLPPTNSLRIEFFGISSIGTPTK